MGIELELHSGRPAGKGSSRETLLRGSYEHGEALASVLSTLDGHGSGKLGWVAPYGDTLFIEQEAQVVRQEVTALTQATRAATAAPPPPDLAASTPHRREISTCWYAQQSDESPGCPINSDHTRPPPENEVQYRSPAFRPREKERR